jgi:hypothetical protein
MTDEIEKDPNNMDYTEFEAWAREHRKGKFEFCFQYPFVEIKLFCDGVLVIDQRVMCPPWYPDSRDALEWRWLWDRVYEAVAWMYFPEIKLAEVKAAIKEGVHENFLYV